MKAFLRNPFRKWLAITLVASILLRVYWFVISVRRVPAYDDECKIALQALDIACGLDFPLLILASPYIFPLDAYIMAPVAKLLSPNAISVRTTTWFVGLGATIVGLVILLRDRSPKEVWPGVVMVLLPSAYVLMLQSAILLPAYPPLMLLGPLAVALTIHQPTSLVTLLGSRWLAGLSSGLASSATMLAAPFLIVSAALSVLQRRLKHLLLAATFFGLGALIGLTPHLLAKRIHRDAFVAVSRTISTRDALKKVWSPLVVQTLPAALGVSPPIFADHRKCLHLWPFLDKIAGILWSVAMVAATAQSARRFVGDWRRCGAPTLSFDQPFIIVSWFSVILFAFSARSHAHTYRYLLPVVISWPMVLAGLYAYSGRFARIFVALTALFFLVLHARGIYLLTRYWDRPGFAKELQIYDLQPAIDYLQSRRIRHAFAAYEDAYRITYQTRKQILCDQPYNRRFPEWPLPYKRDIVAAPKVAYVLSQAGSFTSERFERDCTWMGVRYEVTRCGEYRVYTDFTFEDFQTLRLLSPESLRADASHNSTQAYSLVDGDVRSHWRSRGSQETNMWIEVSWRDPVPLRRVAIIYDIYQYRQDRPGSMRLRVRDASGWHTVLENLVPAVDPFEWVNDRPVYGTWRQTLRFPEVKADALRLEISDPRPNRDWTIGEVEVYRTASDDGSPGGPVEMNRGIQR